MKLSSVEFLSVEHVLLIHAKTGARGGIRDGGLLESAVNAPRNAYVGSFAELAALLAHGIAKNHAFVDGNKRTSFVAVVTFLRLNGYPVRLRPREKWTPIFEALASGGVTRGELARELAGVMGTDGAFEPEGPVEAPPGFPPLPSKLREQRSRKR